MEYNFALQSSIPVLGFVRKDIGQIPTKFSENTLEGKEKLQAFRQKVMSKTCRLFDSASELGMAVMKSLTNEMRINPREGWVPAQQAKSTKDYEKEKELHDLVETISKENERLKRRIRDGTLKIAGLKTSDLAQGSDRHELKIGFNNRDKNYTIFSVSVSWDEIFQTIGPAMYGYIVRKVEQYGRDYNQYPFNNSLEHLIRSYVFEDAQNRKIDIKESDIDTIVIHLKQLGYIEYQENTHEDGKFSRDNSN
ncbi:hypothetical protein AU467_14465 [Mesorhizobium loti]|uniref:Uncharacterized protein n=1 Tax=Rhizobium loti TaxID=381 RepID=A0A101KVS2_RHILI|nr:hypothetical protein AU467_14465 [Mesorhizobium loti]